MSVDSAKHAAYWRDGADEDFQVARGLIDQRRLRHGLFLLHLAMEKLLKSLICKRTGDLAPRIHDLVRLVDLAGIKLDEEKRRFLAELNRYSLEGRYPDPADPLPSSEEATQILQRFEEVYTWLRQP